MDEVDSIGSARIESSGGGGGDSEVQRTMLELLNQLDGFEATNKIKVRLLSVLGHLACCLSCWFGRAALANLAAHRAQPHACAAKDVSPHDQHCVTCVNCPASVAGLMSRHHPTHPSPCLESM